MGAAFDVASLCEAFQRTVMIEPDAVALRTPGGGVSITWREYAARVRSIATGLASLGVSRGHTVGLMMTNRPEFNLCDTAVLHLGAAPFSVYNTLAPGQIEYVLAHSGCRIVLAESQFLPGLLAVVPRTQVEHVICVDTAIQGATELKEIEAHSFDGFDFEATWRSVERHDVLTLIYTSGTTGPPKGVELTHANMLAELRATATALPIGHGDSVISYLPSAHVADRWLSHYHSITYGVQVTCVADATMIARALGDARPTLWGAVPRVWEKLKAALETLLLGETDDERKKLTDWAFDVGMRKVRAEQALFAGQGEGPAPDLLSEYARADDLVFAKLRERVGLNEVRWSISGAAPIARDVLEFFAAMGLSIQEVYGMSELACLVSVNPKERIKLGTVGTPLPGIEMRLAPDGELLCRGDVVMRGYRGDQEKTAETIDADGWLHTGDIASIDGEGYLSIVDRKKELIINAAGKNMSPANIEATLKSSSPLIGHAVAIGDRRPFNVALIVLDPDACAAYGEEHGLADAAPSALSELPDVHERVADAVARANQQLARVEQIKGFRILPDDWQVGGDELTPTMKLKRKPIAEKYAAEIEELYLRQ